MEDRNKKTVAAADVVLPHKVRGNAPKTGPYPADAKVSDGGYGQKKEGKLRVSGDSRSHQIGKR